MKKLAELEFPNMKLTIYSRLKRDQALKKTFLDSKHKHA